MHMNTRKMDRISRSTAAGLVALLALFMLVAPSSAASVQYCSSQNTAETSAKLWDWQSNGWCTDQCKQDYAFAIILEKSCYCSNLAPSEQQPTSDCSDTCPGFPTDKCGNEEDNLYIYIKMDGNEALGTQGSSSSTSANSSPSASETPPLSTTEAAPTETEATTPSSAPSSPSPAPVLSSRRPDTVVQTVTASPPVTSTSTQQPTTTTPTTTPATTPTTTSTSAVPDHTEAELTTTAKPHTSLVVVTQSGQVVTQTVVTTPTASSSPMQVPSQKGSSTGTIVGGVVGGVAGVAAVAGGIFLLLWRRRQQQQRTDDDEGQAGVHRNTSTMSKAGLMRSEKMPQHPPPIATSFTNTRRSSRMMDNESISPISASDRRNSRHLVDQRLNPSAIFVLDNSSRGSVVSMEDSRDYHRPLNVGPREA